MPGPAPAASFVSADRAALSGRVRLVEVVPGSGWRQLAFAVAVARVVAAERPAAAVLWFAAPTYGALTAAACRVGRVPLLVVSGGADVASCPAIGFGDARIPWRRAVVRWILDGAAVVWAFSAAAAREVAAVAPAAQLRVVPPAVDTAFFQPDPATAAAGPAARERLIVSTCAAITPLTLVQKGLDRLVEAVRSIPDATCVITGAPAADPAVAAFVAAAPPNVSFAGYLPREGLRALYGRAAVAAQLSRHEGFGVAAVEASAMGCRVVATRLPVVEEVLGATAETVAIDAPAEAVSAALRAALAAPPPRPRWAELDRRYGVAVRDAAWEAWLAGRQQL